MLGVGSMLATGTTFGRYRIERELGVGGMGFVYEAHDTVLRRSVALKVVRGGGDDDEAKQRLLREARAAAALRHPNAVAVFDVGEIDGVTYIAMELIEGKTLSTYVQAPLPIERKVGWLLEIARALAAAHRAGLVHRDVKPENVMVCVDGTIKVLDFGIAKRAGDASKIIADGPASFRTAEGVVTGTPRYMSPEQLAGAALDGRTDQFAWGVVAYELLSGIHPQSTTGTAERWGAPPAALAKIAPAVPKEISEIVMRALERASEHRWPSLEDVVKGLETFLGITSGAQPLVASEGETRASADEPTMQLGLDEEEPGPSSVSGVRAKGTTTALGITGPSVVVLPRTLEAMFDDASRPMWRRLVFPVLGATSFFAGLGIMAAAVFLAPTKEAPEVAKILIRCGWLVVFFGPAFELARTFRRVKLVASAGSLAVRQARGMAQTLGPGDVGGTSLAPLDDGTFAVAITPRRIVAAPIAIVVPTEDDGHAILAALGESRAFGGAFSWPLRRGVAATLCLVVSIGWRFTITWTYLPLGVISGLGFTLTLLGGVLAAVLAFAPRPGPTFDLDASQIRITGALVRRHGRGAERAGEGTTSSPARDVVVLLRDVVRASATDTEIVVELRTGETLTALAPIPRFSRRALTREERAHLVAHVNAAAIRARAAYA